VKQSNTKTLLLGGHVVIVGLTMASSVFNVSIANINDVILNLRTRLIEMTRAEKIAANKLDKEISKLFHENCSNIQINMMDIPKVFAAAKRARMEGRDMKEEIIFFVQSIRKN
jgi:cystathionine beta-lyase/cystathionine gamma-synthase